MKRWWIVGTILGYWVSTLAYAAPPVRDNTYVAGTTIVPNDVMDNEDPVLEYLQDGVDTYAPNSITTAAIATGGVTSDDILDGTVTTIDLAFAINPGNTLPAGAIFFMITGNCPSWTTDVTATYSNLFIRVNATGGTTGGGASTHTHGSGSYAGTSHTHTIPTTGYTPTGSTGSIGIQSDTGGGDYNASRGVSESTLTSNSSGSGAISGTSASGDSVPAYVTAKLCQVN